MWCLLHRKLIEKATTSLDSARSAKQQMQLFNAQIVQLMDDEYKEMMQQAVDEVSVESRCFQSLSYINTYHSHCGVCDHIYSRWS